MEKEKNVTARPVNRRSFLKKGVLAGGAATIGAGFIGGKSFAFAQERSERPTKGDIAILRFLNALEQIEADLWLQYAELGGGTGQRPFREPMGEIRSTSARWRFLTATWRSISSTTPMTKSATRLS